MSNTLLDVSWTLSDKGYTVIAEVRSGGILPRHIFAYNNTGTSTLGDFEGTVSLAELQRIPIWEGTPIAPAGCRFVRHDQAKIEDIPASESLDVIIGNLVFAIQELSTQYQAEQSGSKTVVIT